MKLCPRWVAPNLLTFVGFIFCFGHFGLLALYDYDFSAATYPAKSGQNSVPGKMKSFQKLYLGSFKDFIFRFHLGVGGFVPIPSTYSWWYWWKASEKNRNINSSRRVVWPWSWLLVHHLHHRSHLQHVWSQWRWSVTATVPDVLSLLECLRLLPCISLGEI